MRKTTSCREKVQVGGPRPEACTGSRRTKEVCRSLAEVPASTGRLTCSSGSAADGRRHHGQHPVNVAFLRASPRRYLRSFLGLGERSLRHRSGSSSALIGLGRRHRYDRNNFRLLGHHDPRNDVGQYATAAEQRDDQPHYADHGHIQIEVFGEAGADPGNLAIHARAHQLATASHGTYSASAVGTQVGVVLNDLSAIVAVHTVLPLTDTNRIRKGSPRCKPAQNQPGWCPFLAVEANSV